MDSNIIDKSDDIVAQLVAQGPELYPKGTLADYKATGKVWGKTSLEWEALGFICQVPTGDDLTICNVRPPASTARPAATASTPSPAAPRPHAPHRPTTRPPPAAGPG